MFEITFSNKARKFLKKCEDYKKILNKITGLKENPILHDSKKIINEERIFRIRVGDYRILYKIVWEKKVIIIARIDKRSKIYKK